MIQMIEPAQTSDVAGILALQEMEVEQENGAAPCFSVSASTITVRTM
ncbi:hypothetical protein ACIQPR_46640 [Streptomyces sp. NPDC091280]